MVVWYFEYGDVLLFIFSGNPSLHYLNVNHNRSLTTAVVADLCILVQQNENLTHVACVQAPSLTTNVEYQVYDGRRLSILCEG